jgi:hypothetical protein
MLKKLLIAAGLAGSLVTFSQAAQAKVNVWIGSGAPGYVYGSGYGYAECQGPLGYRHCYGDGFRYGYRPQPRIYREPPPVYLYDEEDYGRRALSCRQARSVIRDRGFRDVVARDCNGGTYSFFATKRGKAYRVNVNAYSGNIVSLRRI